MFHLNVVFYHNIERACATGEHQQWNTEAEFKVRIVFFNAFLTRVLIWTEQTVMI